MNETGSLIRMHHHENFDILDNLSENEGTLYYKGEPINVGSATGKDYTKSEITEMITALWNELGEEIITPDTDITVPGDYITTGTMQVYVKQAFSEFVTGAVGEENLGGDTSDTTEP